MERFSLYELVRYNGPRVMDTDPEIGGIYRVLDQWKHTTRMYSADKRKWLARVPTDTLSRMERGSD